MNIKSQIEELLTESLGPIHLEVMNESHMHNVPEGSESHFRVVIVSSKFEGTSLIEQHRMVNETLEKLLKSSIHALAIVSKTPKKWENSQDRGKSPKCLG